MMLKNKIISGANNRSTLVDAYWRADNTPKPIVVFCHGYKGYKDWGAWELVAKAFADAGFIFVKFNFSHNGGTIDEPIDFPDLAAFAQNNYSKELIDLGLVIDWCLEQDAIPVEEKDSHRIILMGHSRGGGIAVLKAAQDDRVTDLITWASVSNFESRFPKGEQLEMWRNKGVYHVINGRTKQQMPHDYQFYRDFQQHADQLNIRAAAESLDLPYLIFHGVDDEAVALNEARNLHKWSPNSRLEIIPNTGHTFGAIHPYPNRTLPPAMQLLVDKSITFIK